MENLKDKTLVSVVVPIYNAEKYLTVCVDALLAQTYTHIEILLVNDGSEDRSGTLCDEYAQRDSRVRVLHLQNGGVSRARNHALDVIKGEWVCFADADDEVTPHYIEHFVDAMEEGVDVIISEAVFVHEDGSREWLSYKNYGTLSLPEIFLDNELSAHGYAWAKCYRCWPMNSGTDGLSMRFPEEIKFSEDLIFVIQYLAVSPKAKYIPYADYIYYLRSGSASRKIFTYEIERRCFCEYIAQMQKLSTIAGIELMQLSSSASILSMLFARVRNSMYIKKELSREERVNFYKNIAPEISQIICDNSRGANMLVRLGYKLFMRGQHFKLMDWYFFFMIAIYYKKAP